MGNLIFAGRALVQDLLPTIFFAILVALKVDPVIATGAAILLSVAQIAFLAVRRRSIAPLQWASLGLVLLFGTASLLAHDLRFLMAKPTIVYAIIGAVMLKRGWMLRYMPPAAEGHGAAAQIAFGYVWAGLMFVTAGLNLGFVLLAPALWPAFLATFPLVSKIALFAVQYVTVRRIVIRSAKVAAAEQAQVTQVAQAA